MVMLQSSDLRRRRTTTVIRMMQQLDAGCFDEGDAEADEGTPQKPSTALPSLGSPRSASPRIGCRTCSSPSPDLVKKSQRRPPPLVSNRFASPARGVGAGSPRGCSRRLLPSAEALYLRPSQTVTSPVGSPKKEHLGDEALPHISVQTSPPPRGSPLRMSPRSGLSPIKRHLPSLPIRQA